MSKPKDAKTRKQAQRSRDAALGIQRVEVRLSTRERELAYRKVEDYYFSLNNTHFCYQAAKYLEYRIFENEFVN